MAPTKRQRPETETEMITVEDVEALNCGVCWHPLKPPIFQCKEGHAVCSSCRDNLAPTGKYHVCGVSTRGGYNRNRAMERMVEAVRVTCPNAAHGCSARMVYYDLADHRQVCPHAPCHCPDESCSFVGTTKQLVDHITGSHGWLCTTRAIMARETTLRLKDGFNLFVVDNLVDREGTTTTSTTGVFLFLLNVDRQPFGCAISVCCILPHKTYDDQGPSKKAIKCSLGFSGSYRRKVFHHHLSSRFMVKCTDLSGGLPCTEECFKFVVPNSALEDDDKEEDIQVDVDITICQLDQIHVC